VSTPLALGTRNGVVKRVNPAEWGKQHELSAISLKGDDEVVGAARADDGDDLVFVTSDAQLLRYEAANVRPQGAGAGGMAGVRLGDGAKVIGFSVVADAQRDAAVVVTIAEPPSDEALFTDVEGSAKVTPLSEYPAKGRGTGGVRAQRFVRGETALAIGWGGPGPARRDGARDRLGRPGPGARQCEGRRDSAVAGGGRAPGCVRHQARGHGRVRRPRDGRRRVASESPGGAGVSRQSSPGRALPQYSAQASASARPFPAAGAGGTLADTRNRIACAHQAAASVASRHPQAG